MPERLYQHNIDAYRKVKESFRGTDRAAIVHATGTGKSYVIEKIARDYARVAVIAPNNYVLSEIRKREIRADFYTYPTVMAMKSYPEDAYDLIVLDEFHRAGAQMWGAGVDALLAANPEAKILGTTATEIRYLDGARNMADELFEGNIVSRLPLTEAWLRGILPVPKYIVGLYNYEDIYEDYVRRIRNNSRLSEQDIRQAREILQKGRLNWETSHGVAGILRRHLPADTRRMIVFCDRTESLEKTQYEFIQWMQKAGFRCATYSVHYRNLDSQQEMLDFQNDKETDTGVKVLFAINMLNEGVHVPDVDAVVMLRQTSSKIIMLQQMGRCMSVDKRRQPVIFDLVDNLTSTSEVERIRGEYESLRKEHTAVNDTGNEAPEFTVTDCVKDIRELIFSVNAFRPNRNFEENLELLRHFVMDVGRWPKANSEDKVERAVQAFAFVHRNDNEISELRRWAEENLGLKPWRTTTPFEKNLSALSDFITRERRWPAIKTDDQEERKLYRFALQHLRTKYSGLLDGFRKTVMEEYGCDIQFEEARERVDINKLVEDLNAFLDANGRWPSWSSDDTSEHILASRAQNHKNKPEVKAVMERAEREYGVSFRLKRRTKEESIALLAEFVNAQGRWPERKRNGDKYERYLAAIAYTYREDPAVQATARQNGIVLEYKTIRRIQFEKAFKELQEFVKSRHKWPVAGKNGNNPDRHERDLHYFAARNSKDPRIAEFLSWAEREYGFVYAQSLDEDKMIASAEEFIKENGRWPSSSSKDKDEAKIGSFLSRHKKRHPKEFKEFEKRMSSPKVRPRKTSIYEDNLNKLRQFVQDTGRWPKQDQADPNENSLARFAAHKARKPEVMELRATIDTPMRKPFSERLEELKAFIADQGRWPDNAETYKEKSLNMWTKAHRNEPEVASLRLEAEKKESVNKEVAFQKQVRQLEEFVKTTGKWPSKHDEQKENKDWAYFIRCNRTRPEIVALRDSVRKDSEILVTAPFEQRFEELKEFIRDHHRLPKWNAENRYELDLYHFYMSKKNRPRHKKTFEELLADFKPQ